MYDISEFIVLIICGIISYLFLYKWYKFVFKSNISISGENKFMKYILGFLPVAALAIIFFTLRGLASFDVVEDPIYIIFYILMGFAAIYFGELAMSLLFDISWIDDVLNLGNSAALFAVCGGFLGITLIYSGSNIGDGPGWWCVVFAGGLGIAAWILLGLIINIFTGIFERITIGRDISCGIRTGGYFLASGIILARASAGDWTSYSMTVKEFFDGWVVIPLTVLMIFIEIYYISKSEPEFNSFSRHNAKPNADGSVLYISVLICFIYIITAVLCVVLLPPLNVNPIWRMIT